MHVENMDEKLVFLFAVLFIITKNCQSFNIFY